MEWWGIRSLRPLKPLQKEKEEEILVRGQSKHKWNWKFRERERERERDYLACGWARKSNQKYSNMLLTFSLSFYDKPTHNPYKNKNKNTEQVKWKTFLFLPMLLLTVCYSLWVHGICQRPTDQWYCDPANIKKRIKFLV